ncbi:hemolysin-III related-domain-containing protein [Cladochytrium replicatum]|nr:hemolysin-III related-domain-containing protein [Cladochytrium replicatum]
MGRLFRRDQMPEWMRAGGSEFVISGYRGITHSYRASALSLFYLHNETGNILSHAFGAGLFLCILLLSRLAPPPPSLPLLAEGIAAIVCMGSSTLYHLFMNHSEQAYIDWTKCDYVGIVALIGASAASQVHYSFWCDPWTARIYITIIYAIGGILCLMCISSFLRGPQMLKIRTVMFASFASTTVVPIIHATYRYGSEMIFAMAGLKSFLTMGALYCLAIIIYIKRIPERWSPGTFDIWFHSHQIMHVLTVAAALIHYKGLLTAHDVRLHLDPWCTASTLRRESRP